ncbi:pleiotropic drug resistance 6 [Actinidia rufa]|uniref:Pleiotropic drug resistance 6 n=1 Tax=Actinidia rufa TaxID=165716 RepID=A0A7J0H3X6_9ERIC|nr:pleiotropic drug resistance 6 [Actinidia rufa]
MAAAFGEKTWSGRPAAGEAGGRGAYGRFGRGRRTCSSGTARGRHDAADDEEELKWAAIERLPTYDRVRKGMLQQVMSNGRVVRNEMDVTNLGAQDKKQLLESILKVVEDDNDKFLRRLRDRTDRVGIEIPKIEVRFQNLSIEGDSYVGTRALPTLLNTTLNALEGVLGLIGIAPSKKRNVKILQDVSGIIRPSRLTLLLGPPGAGKTTLQQALAGKSDDDLRIKGKVTYCGKEFKEFVPQRTSAYISQHDLHYGEMTVRETLDFSGRCLGVGTRYEMLLELSRREKEAGIKPDPEIDAFMKATAMAGQETSLITDYVLKILGLDICADIMMLENSGEHCFYSLINVMFNGVAELAMTVFRLPVFYKQRDSLFYPAWAFGLPIWLTRIPVSLVESTIWVVLTYYTIGFAPAASRFFKHLLAFIGVHQMALGLFFRFLAAAGRTPVIANTMGTFSLFLVFVLGGFIVSKNDIKPWLLWGYYVSPMMYGLNAISINEFLDDRWSKPLNDSNQPTVGKTILKDRGLFVDPNWYWISIVGLFGFSVIFNVLFIAALTFLNPVVETKAVSSEDDGDSNQKRQRASNVEGATSSTVGTANQVRKGMVLPFKPLSLAFNHVNYYVDMPAEMKTQGIEENRLQLLRDISGAFRPGVLTALVGLLLMKRGGQVIYAGPLGRQSHKLVEYFEAVPGVPKIKDGINPATWMLEVSTTAVEAQLDVDFAEIYANSDLYRRNQELIKELNTPAPDARDLYFPTQYSQPFLTQCKACFWKQHWSYWRNSRYNAIRFFMTIIFGLFFGILFWKKGNKINKQQDLLNLLGATYSAVLFLGATNASSVQTVVGVERTVFYRERAAGMYSELPYAFAQVAIETIYVLVQTIIYALLLYSMIGYEWTAVKFFYFYYFIFMCFTYFSMYGMMVVALTPGHQFAAIIMSFFLNFWNLFSGFLIPRPMIPIWWRWYYWGSPVAWTIYGLFASQVGDKNDEFHITGVPVPTTVKIFLKESLGFEYDFLVPVVFAHVGWVLVFFFVFAYGIKYLNFQRR